jgi:hypothetical protein
VERWLNLNLARPYNLKELEVQGQKYANLSIWSAPPRAILLRYILMKRVGLPHLRPSSFLREAMKTLDARPKATRESVHDTSRREEDRRCRRYLAATKVA